MLCCFDVRSIEIIARIRIEKTRANTPPNLLRVDPKIA